MTIKNKELITEKRCPKCGETKPLLSFHKDKYQPLKVVPYCKACVLEPRTRKDTVLRRRYNISLIEYERMLEQQGGKCAICGAVKAGNSRQARSFVVDHDHKTGKVRGLLCHDCNTGLGKFKDNLDLLRQAVAYLEQGQDTSQLCLLTS